MKVVEEYGDIAPFVVEPPTALPVPFVFNAPHSGTVYPRALLRRTRLDRMALRRSEDTFVDALFAPVASLGATLMRANFPRVYLDLNRDARELDPAMFDGPLSVPVNADTPRVAGGLGVIARVVGERQDIYAGPLPATEARHRLERFYHPYHDALARLLREKLDAFGAAVLVDCHSMPSSVLRGDEERSGARPDVIIGDRYGTSCSPALSDELARAFGDAGFLVGRNRPYAGGYITEHYGQPPAIQAVQIEINRALYMNETTFRASQHFAAVQQSVIGVFARIVDWFSRQHGRPSLPLAAE